MMILGSFLEEYKEMEQVLELEIMETKPLKKLMITRWVNQMKSISMLFMKKIQAKLKLMQRIS